MASSESYFEYVLEQLSEVDGISSRKMMGEYVLYCEGKIFGGVYDDRLLVKPVGAARALMPTAPYATPYSGGKDMLLVENLDDRGFLAELVQAMLPELPRPKDKRNSPSKHAGRGKAGSCANSGDGSNGKNGSNGEHGSSGDGGSGESSSNGEDGSSSEEPTRGPITERLVDKNAKAARAFADQIVAESAGSNAWYGVFDEVSDLLVHENSYVRNRALSVLASLAPWDADGRFAGILTRYLSCMEDPKPITARQCIKNLPQIAKAKPELTAAILDALDKADVSRYSESMRPLVESDIVRAAAEIRALHSA